MKQAIAGLATILFALAGVFCVFKVWVIAGQVEPILWYNMGIFGFGYATGIALVISMHLSNAKLRREVEVNAEV